MFNFFKRKKSTVCINLEPTSKECKFVAEIKELQRQCKQKECELEQSENSIMEFYHNSIFFNSFERNLGLKFKYNLSSEYNFGILNASLRSLNKIEFEKFLEELTTIYQYNTNKEKIISELNVLNSQIMAKKNQLGIK